MMDVAVVFFKLKITKTHNYYVSPSISVMRYSDHHCGSKIIYNLDKSSSSSYRSPSQCLPRGHIQFYELFGEEIHFI